MISIATILVNVMEYGLHNGEVGYWLTTTMVICYWIYVALAFLFSGSIYLLMYDPRIANITPAGRKRL